MEQIKNEVMIYSVDASNIYNVDNKIIILDEDRNLVKNKYGEDGQPYYNWEMVSMPDSLFLRYMKKKGMTISKKGISRDFIKVSFKYNADVKHKMNDGSEINTEKKGMNRYNLRELYYENGIVIRLPYAKKADKYFMLYRTASAAKEGTAIFIREELYEKANKFLTMGLNEKIPKKNVDIVAWSAYQSLVAGAAEGFITLPWEHILVVKDEEVESEKRGYSVKVKDGHCVVERSGTEKIKNTLWDGQGLLDESVFPKTAEGFVYLRNHFFKACMFRCNIQQWFKEQYGDKYETATVTDMFGKEHFVKDIKAITTNNAIKWIKFKDYMGKNPYKYYERWLEKYNNQFAIIKTGHHSKYGELQRSSYQMINSLPTIDKDILTKITTPSINYINELKLNKDSFIKYLQATASPYKINDVLIGLDSINSDIQYCNLFKNTRSDRITELKNKRIKIGKLLLPGDNLTICGNPIALLRKVTEKNFTPKNEGEFEYQENSVQCYTTRFAFGEKIAGFRNPHNAPNNIICFQNVQSSLIEKYMPNLGDTVIIVNGIGTDVQQRLNGMDYDSDTLFVTNHAEMIKLAEMAYKEYPTIINDIKPDSLYYDNTPKCFADIDNKIQKSQRFTGGFTNLAQLCLSHYYHSKQTELEDVFIISSVLAQAAIDSAKRTFEIDMGLEMNRLSKFPYLYNEKCKKIYPDFFNKVQESKKKKKKNRNKEDKNKEKKFVVKRLNCPMDIIPKIIDEKVLDCSKDKGLQTNTHLIKNYFSDMELIKEFDKCKDAIKNNNIDMIAENIKNVYNAINKYDDENNNEKHILFKRLVEEVKLLLKEHDDIQIKELVAYALSKSGSKIRCHLLTVLFAIDKDAFLNCFLSTQNEQKVA